MLHMFAMTFKCFSVILQVFQTYVAGVLAIFGRMLQLFHLGAAKVDLLMHMLQWDPPFVATCCSCWVTSEQRKLVAGALPSKHGETERRRGARTVERASSLV
jgi:hypothetical protein